MLSIDSRIDAIIETGDNSRQLSIQYSVQFGSKWLTSMDSQEAGWFSFNLRQLHWN